MGFLQWVQRLEGCRQVAALQRLWIFGEAGSDRLPQLFASTGHLALDALLQGGFACGELTEIVGATQVGKTTLALQAVVAAQHQRRAPCLIVDCSCTLSVPQALAAGADARRTLLLRPPVRQNAPAGSAASAAAAELASAWQWLRGAGQRSAAAAADDSFWAMCCMAIQQTGASLVVFDTPDVLGLSRGTLPSPSTAAAGLPQCSPGAQPLRHAQHGRQLQQGPHLPLYHQGPRSDSGPQHWWTVVGQRQGAAAAAWRGPQAMLRAAARCGCAVVATAQRDAAPWGAAAVDSGASRATGPPTVLSAHAAMRIHLLATGQLETPMQAVPKGFVRLSPPLAQRQAVFAGVTKIRPISLNTYSDL
jgi:hypothetical protein